MRISDWSADVCSSDLPALLVHAVEEIFVRLGVLHLVQQELHGIDGSHLHENTAKDPHLRKLVLLDEQLFFSSAGFSHVERGEDALVGDLAVKQIGSASCRETGCHYDERTVAAGSFK